MMEDKKQLDSTQQSQVDFDFNPEEINELSDQTTEIQFLGGSTKEDAGQEEGLNSEEFADFMGEDIPSAVKEEDFSFDLENPQVEGSDPEEETMEDTELNQENNPNEDTEVQEEELQQEEQDSASVQEEEQEEETSEDEDSTDSEQDVEEASKPKMKIKEVKYGMTVITNIGNYENIRTHIEATAEVDNNEDFIGCIQELSNQIRRIGRHEYAEIKRKNMRQPVRPPQQNQQQQSRPQQQNRSQQGQQNYQNRTQQNQQGGNPNQQGQTVQPYGPQQNNADNQNVNPNAPSHPNQNQYSNNQRPQ